MKAETFLANLNARATVDGGLTLDVLARHLAETLEEISEPKSATPRLEDLTNDELREKLEAMGLPTSGNKVELVDRIEAAKR